MKEKRGQKKQKKYPRGAAWAYHKDDAYLKTAEDWQRKNSPLRKLSEVEERREIPRG